MGPARSRRLTSGLGILALALLATAADGAIHTAARIRVAIVDVFYPGDTAFASDAARAEALVRYDAVDVDGDGERDPYYHGDLVARYVAHPTIEVLPYAVTDIVHPKRDVARELRRIARDVRVGTHFGAVVLAWESSTLASAFDRPLRIERAGFYKAQIREWGTRDPSWAETAAVIEAIEDLAAAGVAVYTIAGNGGAGMVNTYAFAAGVVTIAGAEADAEGRWIGRQVFTSAVAKSVYRVRLVRDSAGVPLGYDLDEDGTVDVPIGRTSSGSRSLQPAPGAILKGSSFAAPTALKRDVVLNHH
jgi:hypothetical protein